MNKKPIGILGYGRFGQLLDEILKDDFDVYFYDTNTQLHDRDTFLPLQQLITLPTLFLCLPISHLETTLKEIGHQIQSETVIDTCSVKLIPVDLLLKHLNKDIQIIASHPMFGPDSFYSNTKKTMMMHPTRIRETDFSEWKNYFTHRSMHITIMTPSEHDRQSAFSQNITHVVGRTLATMDLKACDIDTQGYSSLLDIITQTCHDSWELFHDMITYNPYANEMLDQLQKALSLIIHSCQHYEKDPNHGK